MAIRDKLRERTQPFLEPGESIEEIFPAEGGASPWMMGLGGGLFIILLGKPRVVAVTDRALVICKQSKWKATPTEVLGRLPRETKFGPVSGRVWAKISLSGDTYYVARKFHDDVRNADAALANPNRGLPEPGQDRQSDA
jgi:hypothetical protein